MVVAQLGLSMAVIEKPIYSVVVFMAVATTVIAPSLLNFAYKGEPSRKVEEQFQIG
jgi:Kef-type K+ transport system membrane component KefB